MGIVSIVFIAAYLVVLVNYFFSETSGNFPRRAINKIIMATMFLLYAYSAVFLDGSFAWHTVLLLAAFAVAWLGDVLLLWSFKAGGIAFMVSNIMFFAYEIWLTYSSGLSFGNVWWSILVFLAGIGTMSALYFAKKVDFKPVGKLMLLYLMTVTLHGSLGLALACNVHSARVMLLGFGLALFMCSDYFLTVHKFIHKEKWVLRCNSGTYFIGMMLAALSLSF